MTPAHTITDVRMVLWSPPGKPWRLMYRFPDWTEPETQYHATKAEADASASLVKTLVENVRTT